MVQEIGSMAERIWGLFVSELGGYNEEMGEDMLLEHALRLPVEERAELVIALLRSLDDEPDADVEKAWTIEVQKRLQAVVDGSVGAVPWETVRDNLRERLKNL